LSSCSEWGVAWLDQSGEYWRIVPSAVSPFGQTLNLDQRYVWWMHGHKTLRVAPGRYRVFWALHCNKFAFKRSQLHTVTFIVRLEDGPALIQRTIPEEMWRLLEEGWKEVVMGTIEISVRQEEGREWSNVVCEVRETMQRAKGGLNLSHLRLERLSYDDDLDLATDVPMLRDIKAVDPF